jgi:hypothetical protein
VLYTDSNDLHSRPTPDGVPEDQRYPAMLVRINPDHDHLIVLLPSWGIEDRGRHADL